jgi:TolA-binding protein
MKRALILLFIAAATLPACAADSSNDATASFDQRLERTAARQEKRQERIEARLERRQERIAARREMRREIRLEQRHQARLEQRRQQREQVVAAQETDQTEPGCTPGYSPCLPPASDYDCAGGTGDGPEYTGPVTVSGSDPYGLDSDSDGVGCES